MSAAKKSFKNNPALSFISSAADSAQEEQQGQQIPEVQEVPTVQDAPSTQEVKQYGDPVSKTTQGKKGKKLQRINMAFSPENMEHIQLMARVMGCSATEYVNRLIAADREERGAVVAQAIKLFEEVKK